MIRLLFVFVFPICRTFSIKKTERKKGIFSINLIFTMDIIYMTPILK